MQRKAMVFAAGLGTRLRPLTNDRPKALVEVAGVPMIERVLLNLRNAGFNDVTVNVHHFAKKVIDYVDHRGHDLGMTLHISDESGLLLDTGGGILHAADLLRGAGPILVHNADILTDLDLNVLYNAHLHSNADATLLTAERNTQRYFLFDNDMRLRGWTNLATGEFRPDTIATDDVNRYQRLAFGGIHVLSPNIFDALQTYSAEVGPVFSITPFYLHECNRLNIMGYRYTSPYQWFDIGKPDTLARAETALAAHKC